jgi:osmoprotectant transport system ATP-binding protein
MLMDEPFGAVDPIVRERLQDQFLRIQSELRKTIVFVTHDVDEAIKMADRIAILNVGGVIEQFASPEEILRSPANDFVRRFVGQERALKRLSLLRAAEAGLSPVPPSFEGPSLRRDASLRQALDVIVASSGDAVAVTGDGDETLGVITLEAIKKELTR